MNRRKQSGFVEPPRHGECMKRVVALLVTVAAVHLSLASARAQEARSLAEFCGVWQGVCNRTCAAGAGNCRPVCAQRRGTCLSTQCFPFNRPGPRCFNSAADRALTDAALAPDPRRERERRQRAR